MNDSEDSVRRLSQLNRQLGGSSLNSVVKSIGKRRFMELARYAPKSDADVQRVIDEWDGLGPFLQRQVELSYLCLVKCVDPYHFLFAVAEAELRFYNSAGVVIAALNSPAAFDRIIHEGCKPKGTKQRKMLMQLYGALPTPKGAQAPLPNRFAARPTRRRS